MPLKILHYVFNGPPIASGYTMRTHSIAKAQSLQGIELAAALSLQSLINNYFKGLNFPSKNIHDNIPYYSAYNELVDDQGFKLISKFRETNRVTEYLRRKFYLIRREKILFNYYKFLQSEIGNIDLIHSHTPSISFNEASIINKYFKKKLIYEVRGFWKLSSENFNQEVLPAVKEEIEACRKADKCIPICKGIADVLINGGVTSDKIEIVPNGVNPDKFINTGKDQSLLKSMQLEDKIIFGYITSVRWLEGIQTIVKAWKRIKKEIPSAVFLLIGDGNYLEMIKSMVKEYDIHDSFITLGRIENKQIAAYYSLLDVFVVPRVNVPVSNIVSPLKPLEAMAAGKAIIVSDVNALKEMVSNGETGLYFSADDHENLAEVSIELARDNGLRNKLSQNAREWVLKNRTWDKLAAQYYEIYEDLLG